MRERMYTLADTFAFLLAEIRRTFRNDEQIGPFLSVGWFPKASGRKKLVAFHRAMVIHQQDAQSRSHVTVLKGIVQQDDFRIGRSLRGCKLADTPAAVSIYGHVNAGKLAGHLVRLVTDVFHLGGRRSQYETF